MDEVAENSSTTVGEEQTNTQTEQTQQAEPQQDTQAEGLNTSLGAQPANQEPVTYDFKESIPEGFEFSQAESDKFVDVIKDMGLSNDQANAIVKYGCDWAGNIAKAVQDSVPQQLQAQADNWAADMKKQYGAGYDEAFAKAGQAIEYLQHNGVPDIVKMFSMTGAGSRVEMMQLLNVVSNLIESDPGKAVGGKSSAKGGLDSFYNNSDFSRL